jgi:hypothetical protein
MKPNQTVPLLTALAPAFAAAPPLLIGGAIVLGVIWVLSDKDETTSPSPWPSPEKPAPVPSTSYAPPLPARQPKAASRRIVREDLAEALEYGARSLTRGEAVAALQARGYRKTAAYKALLIEGKFGDLLEYTPDGLIEWKG